MFQIKENQMSERLIIKATFLLDEKLRTNNLKIKMLGEEVQMFLDNGIAETELRSLLILGWIKRR